MRDTREAAIIWKAKCGKCGRTPLVAMPHEPKFCVLCGAPNPSSQAIGVNHDPQWRSAKRDEEAQ